MEQNKEEQNTSHLAAKRAALKRQQAIEDAKNRAIPIDQQEISLSDFAVRQPKSKDSILDSSNQQVLNFDERAALNTQKVSKIHEFKRSNIKDYEPSNENLFTYSEDENEIKYTALKIENIFRFQNTFKAIKWGVAVGAMFGIHRFIRKRDIQKSVNSFIAVSAFSFFNIWLSYGIQEFMVQHGSTKGLQTAARNEYHVNAYKNYIQRQQDQIELLDYSGASEPVFRNSQSESMDLFIQDLEKSFHTAYLTENIDLKEQIIRSDVINLFRNKEITKLQMLKILNDKKNDNLELFYSKKRSKNEMMEEFQKYWENAEEQLKNI